MSHFIKTEVIPETYTADLVSRLVYFTLALSKKGSRLSLSVKINCIEVAILFTVATKYLTSCAILYNVIACKPQYQ